MDEIDVVVAGAGAAGLAASVAAAQNGASTLVVEPSRRYRATCNTVQTAGIIPAPGTRWQREAGITDDSPERFYADIDAKTKGRRMRRWPGASRALPAPCSSGWSARPT